MGEDHMEVRVDLKRAFKVQGGIGVVPKRRVDHPCVILHQRVLGPHPHCLIHLCPRLLRLVIL